ncbi:hypothetical protein J41TS12_17770 [Paenibacillus antibioticophila]|uniref:Uncharacterized protein n=1 Tax=Paenibacillus antibioticophila TaxID=1274374 RepID=A0A919XR69_9BACL|nr:helix-turn-helix domain-containing protein [Paenibacillus antibioticophila]GIO36916.1 hypothetical protein J41TS12_17770 [Paenibacillus antibioticophila]
MKYANLLSNAVAESGWTYSQVIQKCKGKGVNFSKSYLSKIATGVLPPPSDEINKVLADVLSPVSSISYTDLALAKYKEIIPSDVLVVLAAQ